MGNTTNRDQWAVRERLRYVERCAWWRGVVNRHFLADYFGLSLAQVSSDLQAYQEINQGALTYNLSRKRYEGVPGMACVLHEPSIEEAMRMFLPGGEAAGQVGRLEGGQPSASGIVAVEVLALPHRPVVPMVARRVFLAVLRRGRVRIHYYSMNSGRAEWRWVRPHAFAHDGSRWHIRAWCDKNHDFRDFSLGRTTDAEWPEEDSGPLPAADTNWETWVTLKLRPHAGLAGTKRSAVELDYGMKDGTISIPVRRAMEDYLRAQLRLPLSDGTELRPNLELAE